jgi:Domain of unknown function (DUF4340)
MDKKLAFLLMLFLGMGIAAFFLSKNNNSATSSLDTEDKKFAIKDTANIGKIYIANRKAESVTLTRQNNGTWKYGDYAKARPAAVNMLLENLYGLTLKYTLPRATLPNVVKDLASEGIKVEIYDKKYQLISEFYIGGAVPDGRGTYMIRANAEVPYAISVAGWEGDIRTSFNMFNPDDWLDRTIFQENPQNIKRVKVEYPKQTSATFVIEAHLEAAYPYRVSSPYSNPIEKPIKKGTPEAYLMGFERVVAESFLSDAPQRDSIIKLVPFAIITVTHQDNSEKTVKLFPYTSYDKNGAVRTKNEHFRYYADCSNGNFMLVQHPVIGKLLWGYSFFY